MERATGLIEGAADRPGIAEFVEHLGVFFEASGVPRAAGRMLGWLLVCDPPHQSSEDLARALAASSGGVSTSGRLLIQSGFVERIGVPGDRRAYYRVRPDAWTAIFIERQVGMARLKRLAAEGLAALDGSAPERRQRLEQMYGFAAFVERELPALMQRYLDEKDGHA